MKDIPVFTTEFGAASLVLRQVPYRGIAYIRLQATMEPERLLAECVDFCRAVGAERVYATGHSALERYPFHTAIWKMTRSLDGQMSTDAVLRPVEESTLESWRGIYNAGLANVPNSAWLTQNDGKEMLREGDGYFVYRGDTLLGIGKAAGERLDAVVAVQPGAGGDVVRALTGAMTGKQIVLEVASANVRAVRLYERLGFTTVEEVSRWYLVSGGDDGAG